MNRREFVGAGLALAAPPGTGAKSALKLGSLNLRDCFAPEHYARLKEVSAELAELRDRFARDLAERRKALEKAQEQAAQLPSLGELQIRKLLDAGHAEYDLKALQEIARRKAREVAREHQARIYAEILRVVGLVAEAEGIDLVVRSGDPRGPADDAAEGGLDVLTRDVLHVRGAVDLTPAVLTRLNADWAAAPACKGCRRKVTTPLCPDCKTPPR